MTQVAARPRDFFSHVLNFAALAPAAGAVGVINVSAASDFIWHKGSYLADIAAAAQTDSTRIVPLVTVLLTDSGSRRPLMDNPVPVSALFGSGELPYILPIARRFLRNSSITVTVANFSAATTYNLRLVFTGVSEY